MRHWLESYNNQFASGKARGPQIARKSIRECDPSFSEKYLTNDLPEMAESERDKEIREVCRTHRLQLFRAPRNGSSR